MVLVWSIWSSFYTGAPPQLSVTSHYHWSTVLPLAYEASKRYSSEKYGMNLPVYVLLSCGSMGGVCAIMTLHPLGIDSLLIDCLLVVMLSVRYLSHSFSWSLPLISLRCGEIPGSAPSLPTNWYTCAIYSPWVTVHCTWIWIVRTILSSS